MIPHRLALVAVLLFVAAAIGEPAAAVAPPAPYGPTPSPRQLDWHRMELIGFLHFGVNTFTGKQWGEGDESPEVFAPSAFDADQIAGALRAAGMKQLIFTAKHHDGFCLWPSKLTDYSVKRSPWKKGEGDVVRELADACRRQGLKLGLYLSPWDRNHKDYGRPEYLTYFRDQLRELLTGYGPLGEVWFDGANGGTGYYGGVRERRSVDRRTYYDWPTTWKLVRELQPDACLFSDGGPDVRWVGNERGVAGDPSWATLNADEFGPGYGPPDKHRKRLMEGDRPGTHWLPAECDVSIRPGWFHDAAQDDKVKSATELVDLYYQCVGRGAVLLLNVPPDRRGLIHDNDIRSLQGLRQRLDATFADDLARKAVVTASASRGASYAAANLTDGNLDTYWTTEDDVTAPEVVFNWAAPVTFGVVSLREHLPLGQRIEAFALDTWQEGRWVELARATSIGNRRLVRGAPVKTDKVRLRILQAPACPALAEVAFHAEPVLEDETGAR